MTKDTKDAPVINYAEIGAAAAEGEDQTQMKEGGGGFDRPLPEAGACMLRLRQYMETGVQPSRNPKYKPSQQVILSFEINSPKHMIELEDGTKIPNQITIYMAKGGKTSQYGKLFTALNYSGKYKHFAEMVGTVGWLADITHNVVGDGKDKKTYANLYEKASGWSMRAPVFENPATGDSTSIAVPELDGDPMVFLYENPGLGDAQYLSLWRSIFIEGEHESGDKKGESKNWIQEKIMSSLKFPDSRLASLLGDNVTASDVDALENVDIDENATDTAPTEKLEEDAPVKQVEEKPVVDKTVVEETIKEVVEEIDPLVAAGLV